MPESSVRETNDDEIGVVDGPWLGLLPTSVDKVIKTRIIREARGITDREIANSWKLRMQQSWREIKALIMGRAAGIHKIITSTFQQRESNLIEEHNLHHLVKEVMRKKQKRKRHASKNNKCIQTPAKKGRTESSHTKNCDGITCGCDAKRWCPCSEFQTNRVPINRKQCQRCSMFCTAMNVTADLLGSIAQHSDHTTLNLINQSLKAIKKARTPYSSLMDLLKVSAPDNKHFVKAKFISKNRPNEKWKRVCRIIITVIQQSKQCNPEQSPNNIIQLAIESIDKAIKKSNSAIQSNKTNLQNYLQELSNNSTTETNVNPNDDIPEPNINIECKPPVSIPPPAATPIKCNPRNVIDLYSPTLAITIESPESLIKINKNKTMIKDKLDIMDQSSWMTGAQLTFIIEVLRSESIGQDIYIASTQASHIISTWEPNHGWHRFARIFNNHRVTHRKPNGLYLIPIFAGDVSRGHWFLLVVEKSAGAKKGFVIDSLGTGNTTTSVTQKISDAFAPGRSSPINWSSPISIIQQGCECGPRTACAMETLCIEKRNLIGIQESIGKATLTSDTTAATYDQMNFRRRAATLLGRHAYFRDTA